MSEHAVYSLAKTLQNTNGLERELGNVLSGFRDTLEKDYLLKIRSAADFEKNLAHSHPPREVTLLRALSAYMDESGKQQVARMTKSLLFLHTMQQIRQDVSALSAGNLLEARSADANAEGEEPLSPQATQLAALLMAMTLAEEMNGQ